MRGSPPAKALSLTDRQLSILEKHHSKSTISYREKERIGIVLELSKGIAIKVLARQMGISVPTVKKWRNRWKDSYERLCLLESSTTLTANKYKDELLAVFADLPRSGAPIQITLAQKEQLVALACEKPEKYELPLTHWNRKLLSQTAISQGIVKKISPRYISVILKKAEASTS